MIEKIRICLGKIMKSFGKSVVQKNTLCQGIKKNPETLCPWIFARGHDEQYSSCSPTIDKVGQMSRAGGITKIFPGQVQGIVVVGLNAIGAEVVAVAHFQHLAADAFAFPDNQYRFDLFIF